MNAPKPDDLRDPRLDAAWRVASNEEPPAMLDEAIRAAARREVGAGPRPAVTTNAASRVPEATRPERWWWPLAAAATIGAIAFGLLQLMPTGNEGPTVVSDMPASAPAETRTPAAPPTTTAKPAFESQPAESVAPPKSAPDRPPAPHLPPTRAAAPAPAPPLGSTETGPLPDAFPAGNSERAAESRADAPRSTRQDATGSGVAAGAIAPQVARRESDLASDATALARSAGEGAAQRERVPRPVGATLPAEEWIALIRRLRDEGKTELAERELTAFRAAYPDHEQRLPADLRDWRIPAR